jgi:hypothetical protein
MILTVTTSRRTAELGDIVGSISDESDWEAAQDPESDK